MNALLVNCSNPSGGAAKAAHRLARALAASGVEATLRQSPAERPFTALALRRQAAAALLRLQRSAHRTDRSINAFPSGLAGEIDRSECDVVHLHWIGAEALRIEQLATIRKPIVWTLHDEWAFCGGEHYAAPGDERFRHGYAAASRPPAERGLDLDSWAWRRKRDAWRALQVHFVCPSRWLAERAQASALFRDRPVTCIPNTLPLDTYAPAPRSEARHRLGLPADATLIGFGAAAALSDPRKGFPLLRGALDVLAQRPDAGRLRLVLFGRDRPLPALPLPVHDLGILTDENRLADALRAMDVFVCPSLQENLPNTVLEALACGIPCVAFRTGGLPELIEHGENGWLSRPGSASDLAEGIGACLEPHARRRLAARARAKVESAFAPQLVARRHLALYEEVSRGLAGRASAWNIAR